MRRRQRQPFTPPANSSSCFTRRSRRRPAAPAVTPPSAPSRRCASRSTASWIRCGPRCPPPLPHWSPGGRVVVMAYQSLEDRIVKSVFAAATASRDPARAAGRTSRSRAGIRGGDTRCRARRRRRDRTQSAKRRRRLRAVRAADREGSLMKSRRQAPKAARSRGGGAVAWRRCPMTRRRRRADGRPAGRRPAEAPPREKRPKSAPGVGSGPRTARAATGPALPRPLRFHAGPAEDHQPGQGARQGPQGQGAQACSRPAARADASPG